MAVEKQEIVYHSSYGTIDSVYSSDGRKLTLQEIIEMSGVIILISDKGRKLVKF